MDFAIFAICAALIGAAGPTMVRSVEAVSIHTGMGRVWAGTILLAGATSLPELVTTVTAGATGEADLAVGTVLGSNMFNMTIFAAALFVISPSSLPTGSAVRTGLLAITLGLATTLFLVTDDVSWGRLGLGATILIGVYVSANVLQFRRGRRGAAGEQQEPQAAAEMSARRAYGLFAATAAVVFVAATFLPGAAEGIAETLGVTGGVVGVVGLAFATSLPEVVTSVSALRRGAHGLVVGNVFGSNIFNMAVLFPADLAFNEGSILRAASSDQAVTAGFGIVLMVLALAAFRRGRGRGAMRAIGFSMMGLYAAGIAVTVALGMESG